MKTIALGLAAFGLSTSAALACVPFIQVSNFPNQGYAYGQAVCRDANGFAAVTFQLSYQQGGLMSSFGGSGDNGNCVLNFTGGSEGFPSGYTIAGPASEGVAYGVLCYAYDGTLYGVQTDGCSGGYCNGMQLYP